MNELLIKRYGFCAQPYVGGDVARVHAGILFQEVSALIHRQICLAAVAHEETIVAQIHRPTQSKCKRGTEEQRSENKEVR